MVFLVAVIYHVENWRGERAWQLCKRQLESKGQKMEWAAWVPAPIPDSENFFAAPQVKDWFTTPSPDDFTRRFSAETVDLVGAFSSERALAHVSIVSPATELPPGQADIVLRYVASGKAAFLQEHAADRGTNAADSGREIIPLIMFDDVPFQDAIKNLARQGGFACVLHPELFQPRTDADEPPALPVVTMRLENVTIEQALVVILNHLGFELVPAKSSNRHLVRLKPRQAPEFFASAGVRKSIAQLLSRAVGRASAGTQGNILLAEGGQQIKPIRIVLQTERVPSPDELVRIIPGPLPGPASLSLVGLSPKPAGDGYDLYFAERPLTAADYLKWSERFTPDIDALREALKRPGARLPGEYRDPRDMPRLNFVAVRMLAQMLAQRAKAHLLLSQPEAALQELTLVHALRRPLQAKPVTLISAMINVAVTGMYEDVVGDGLSLRAWREPQLIRIQQQLRDIDLPPLVAEGLQLERAFSLHTIALPPAQLWKLGHIEPRPNSWQQYANPKFLMARFSPHGWIKNSMALAAQLQQTSIDTYDPGRRRILPSKSEEITRWEEHALQHWSPRTCLAALAVPNFNRAWILTARSQAMAKEALIACALERYRLSRGDLPKSLEELVPEFLDSVPQDVIIGSAFRYKPLGNSRFLLYSPGWNQVDEGGEPLPVAYGPMDVSQGDWAWLADES